MTYDNHMGVLFQIEGQRVAEFEKREEEAGTSPPPKIRSNAPEN